MDPLSPGTPGALDDVHGKRVSSGMDSPMGLGIGRNGKMGFAGNPLVELRIAQEKAREEEARRAKNKVCVTVWHPVCVIMCVFLCVAPACVAPVCVIMCVSSCVWHPCLCHRICVIMCVSLCVPLCGVCMGVGVGLRCPCVTLCRCDCACVCAHSAPLQ